MEKQVADRPSITYPSHAKQITDNQTPAQKHQLEKRTERTKKILKLLKNKQY